MELEDFRKEWKKILIDSGVSEAEFWRARGVSQPAGNRKIRTGTIKHLEYINLLDSLGYTFQIRKKED